MVAFFLDAHPRVVNALPMAVSMFSPTPHFVTTVPAVHPSFVGGAA